MILMVIVHNNTTYKIISTRMTLSTTKNPADNQYKSTNLTHHSHVQTHNK